MKLIKNQQKGLPNTQKSYLGKKSFVPSFKKPFFLTSILYIVAAICECIWFYILLENIDSLKRWLDIPVVGWVMAIIFIGMVVMVPLMLIIGIKLFILIKRTTSIYLTQSQVKKRKTVNLLLIVGISADIIFSSILIFSEVKDKSAIVFACALFGGKILQANFEAVALYFEVKKNKSSLDLVKTIAA